MHVSNIATNEIPTVNACKCKTNFWHDLIKKNALRKCMTQTSTNTIVEKD
jgi:hypothetical protein